MFGICAVNYRGMLFGMKLGLLTNAVDGYDWCCFAEAMILAAAADLIPACYLLVSRQPNGKPETRNGVNPKFIKYSCIKKQQSYHICCLLHGNPLLVGDCNATVLPLIIFLSFDRITEDLLSLLNQSFMIYFLKYITCNTKNHLQLLKLLESIRLGAFVRMIEESSVSILRQDLFNLKRQHSFGLQRVFKNIIL